jgi:hypothetical protein
MIQTSARTTARGAHELVRAIGPGAAASRVAVHGFSRHARDRRPESTIYAAAPKVA